MSMWSKQERETLRQMMRASSREEIVAALPGRTWAAICAKAQQLGVYRRGESRNWLAIAQAHKPRIILASPIPIERVWP